MAESGQPIPSSELLLKRKDGSLVPVFSHHTIVKVAGQPQELFCIDIDLTDSKQVENKLKESEQRYRNLFDQANEGLILLTMDGKIAELNNSFAQMHGYTVEEMKNMNPAFIELFGSVPPPEFSIFDDLSNKSAELGNLISRVKNGGMVHLPDLYFNAHDAVEEVPDIPLWIRALIFPLKDSAGKPRRFVFMHENITERKIAEQELIRVCP